MYRSTIGECTTVSETGVSESQIEEMSLQKDNIGLMKAAFLLYIRKNIVSNLLYIHINFIMLSQSSILITYYV